MTELAYVLGSVIGTMLDPAVAVLALIVVWATRRLPAVARLLITVMMAAPIWLIAASVLIPSTNRLGEFPWSIFVHTAATLGWALVLVGGRWAWGAITDDSMIVDRVISNGPQAAAVTSTETVAAAPAPAAMPAASPPAPRAPARATPDTQDAEARLRNAAAAKASADAAYEVAVREVAQARAASRRDQAAAAIDEQT